MTSAVSCTVESWVRARRLEIAEAVTESLGGASMVALVGFPRYRNAGDAAIWLGAKAVLADLGVEVAYQADDLTFDVSAMRRAVGSNPVLITGGGNLGTLWPRQHAFREHVIQASPSNRVIQLSQSANFDCDEAVYAFGAVVAAHGDVWIHLRDRPSEDLIASHAPAAQVRLVPDLAIAAPIDEPPSLLAERDGSLLWIGRADIEAVDRKVHGATKIIDWAQPEGADVVERAALKLFRQQPSTAHGRLRGADRLARYRVARACRAIQESDSIVTSRLHGHLLCVLTGRAHAVIPDRHGKILHFAQTWGSVDLGIVQFLAETDDAAGVARSLVSNETRTGSS